ncbi:MAG: biotin transporter BioY [Heliobacteriaceae bacterium]|nr:biotin transporter BioY [Heliobacteriaceae bacterium]MDD4587272.1 biotin transporter BioY [Heliobacteriaceae bacterium]
MKTQSLTLSALIAAIIFISAQIAFPLPFSPVPVTLQVFTVLLFPLILPARIAVTGICVYLALGLIGLPVFAGVSGGIGILLTPKGGYLLGFLLATIVISQLAKLWPRSDLIRNLLLSLVGLGVIYVCGVTGMVLTLNISLAKALVLGLWPFLPGDLVKVGLASFCAVSVSKRLALQQHLIS